MRILLIGSGGREAALAWKMAQSDLVSDIIVSPGNPGMKQLSSKIAIKQIAQREDYLTLRQNLVVIGPEVPLSEGLSDFFDMHSIPVVGPSQKAALLEGSKVYCKEVLEAAGIATPFYKIANSFTEAELILETWTREGVVVKVDALAQGKGVIVCKNKEEALVAARSFFDGSYLGQTVNKLLLEELIVGPEVSAFALCDGENFIYLGSATDYKRLQDQNLGPNTGGMGTISPSPILSEDDEQWIKQNIFAPTLKVMQEMGSPFKGFLFAGLMKTDSGIKTLEFNTRMGDPETQSLLPRLTDDIVPLLMAAASGKISEMSLKKSFGHAIHVVFSAEGYPGTNGQTIRKGDVISVKNLSPGTFFFTAGVTEDNGRLLTSGGRVCGLTVVGNTLREARAKVYQETSKVQFKGAHFRQDIGAEFL